MSTLGTYLADGDTWDAVSFTGFARATQPSAFRKNRNELAENFQLRAFALIPAAHGSFVAFERIGPALCFGAVIARIRSCDRLGIDGLC